jgi:uncharacterized protein YbcI
MLKTQGAIEAAICEGVTRFEQDYSGRGPKEIRAYLLGDFIVVRLRDLLTPAEQQLAKFPTEKGRDLLKQVRTQLIETAKPHMQALVQGITGVPVVSLHHDVSTVTGEAFIILTLAEPPDCRPAKKAQDRSTAGEQRVKDEDRYNTHARGMRCILPIDPSAARAQGYLEGGQGTEPRENPGSLL